MYDPPFVSFAHLRLVERYAGDMSAEPMDVGPLFGGNQPVLASDRQLVINLLTAARNDSRLTEYDYNTRLNMVYNARTFDDLVPITRDLMS